MAGVVLWAVPSGVAASELKMEMEQEELPAASMLAAPAPAACPPGN